MRRLSKKIQDLRLSLGMRQSEFAKAIGGVDQSTVSKWENERQKPAFDQIMRIAELANVTPKQFMGIEEMNSSSSGIRTVRVTGELCAGEWSEAQDWPAEDQYEVAAPLPPEWSDAPLVARVVQGNSMNKVYPEGTIVYLAPLASLARSPVNGGASRCSV